jgi:hypothetical protein
MQGEPRKESSDGGARPSEKWTPLPWALVAAVAAGELCVAMVEWARP